ncbi:type VI secretion system contractile sheath small subunit [Buttiauxella sp. A2-C1_F]|uniref:type VI secretion system contractile sheath small subunit n=1 Tax=unclassified Buttiauxella TaxID=2634062 RepID=UPI001E3B5694|nr:MULTISPECIES: type VI secretion system contractile sheath small subunit [unclassified Buttiauxella]MCE0798965.1 type VI secretion system contractile sheath small subunit [Buttiauxella sp. W03-F01]MCE0811558.1 type VI secretion system contractile sheath small subunit [Buttiauxella sp. S04-F03]MCE0844165.1 type VI secretion system contractile sheath small subunit [Buttiauxella sp. A2-C1_F]
MSNTQSKLSKARPPRVQISYDVETGGAQESKELPLVIGVMGEFTKDDTEFRDRNFIKIDKDNFNEVMEGMAPKVELLVDSALPENEGKLAVELKFNSLDDFTPDNIVAQVEPLRKLLELREQLSDLRNRTASNDRLKEQLIEMLNQQNNSGETE